ncbi:MAG: aminotransferase class I/II-fold pyridoxal phosphate-dependent enzyme, partial [Firmicutes bacterium]|nr:aminotransferase class I/II-fold pyridoxal phosphate-dependent enzyme [Bacillota bacterium]
MKLNHNFEKLEQSYLFSTIVRKVAQFQKENPGASVIRMGIGDVTRPLGEAVEAALVNGALEQGKAETFHGYGPEQGYDFLREAIASYYKEQIGADVNMEDVFVSDGAKSDVGNVLDLFSADNTVLIPDPVYPVYLDTNVMDGRRIVFMQANQENGFLPMPDRSVSADLIYLCSPNNPTGACYNREQLSQWV